MTFYNNTDVLLNLLTNYVMKTTITLLVIMMSWSIYSQQPSTVVGGNPMLEQNHAPCIAEEQKQEFLTQIDKNVTLLREQGRFIEAKEQGNHPLFIWPVEQEDGFDYHSIWALTNYVDHDANFPNQIQDFECGTRSYDTTAGYNHTGYDIATWPFWWKQMELDQAINIAAADGQIVGKQDGNFDKNCSFNSDPLNGIAIQHSDGSRSLYFHFKDGGITDKEIGDTVVAGEFLGVIGSSGSSTGPHLHFEVFDSGNNLIDPTVGPCNGLNTDTWWEEPISYYNPGINAVLTHTNFPEFNTCPEVETTHESNQFEMGDTVTTAIYLRDQRPDTSVHLRTIRPDNTVQFEWDFDLVDSFNISWWGWQIPADMEGTWAWEATYMGETVTHNFDVGVLGVQDQLLNNVSLYPNPTSGALTLNFTELLTDLKVTVTNLLGQTISERNVSNQQNINLSLDGASGLYFVKVDDLEKGLSKTFKVIKN